MSTIPSGLTAKQMRLRMLDKATITKTGSLYMGGTTAVSYQDVGTTISAYDIVELEAGAQYYPLISQGEGNILNYEYCLCNKGNNNIRNLQIIFILIFPFY